MNYFSSMFIFLLIQLTSLFANEGKCLESCPSDFTIELKKIDIPNHPHAFNPSIIRWEGKLLLSFREVIEVITPSVPCAAESIIGLVFLDEEFNPEGEVYILDLESKFSRPDDARLVKIGDSIFVLYSDNTDEVISDCGFRMWMGKLLYEEGKFVLKNKEKLAYFEGEQASRREKNWVPFDYKNHLCLAYSLIPHRIFLPLPGTECCFTLAETNNHFEWKWGEPRGGTPALKVGNHYLSFFHSSIDLKTVHSDGEKVPHYFIGAYLFSASPPFEITHVSTKPIIEKGFYSGAKYTPYWKPVCAVFPCGILVEGIDVVMTYGRQDHEVWIGKMNLFDLLDTLDCVDSE